MMKRTKSHNNTATRKIDNTRKRNFSIDIS